MGGVIARWRHAAAIEYGMDSLFNISISNYFQKSYRDVPSTITLVPRRVSPYDTFDGQASYLGLKSLKLTVGARNLFDRKPPYANYASSANNFIGGYDVSYGDPRGRFVYASVAYTLH